MASTNPLKHDNSSEPASAETSERPTGKRLRSHSRRASVRGEKKQSQDKERGELDDYGLPDWEGLRPIVSFLIFPALFAIAIVLTGGGWEPIIMYGIAGIFGLYVAFSTLKGVELVFACILFYIPFSKTYAIPIAPMVNGTNILIFLGLFASLIQSADKRRHWLGWPPGTTLVTVFALFTMFSAITVLRLPGGFSYLRYNEFLNYKSWVDQFILFVIAISCIRDVKTAKRMWVYMMVGSIFVVLYSVPEMLEKMGRSTIEKSRITGPHKQSNNFGGFIAYTTLPLAAFFLVYIRDFRVWILSPYFLVFLKVLISTFSRGAYLAFAAGALFSGYLKSGRFLLFWALFVIAFFAIFPQVLPDAVLARMGAVTETKTSSAAPEKLDRSSEVRLIMWRASSRMILESPILGKGFKAFPKLKEDYVEQFVEESDPHNMYLYLGSQMGLPAVVLFLYIMGFVVYMGVRLARGRVDRFSRAIGIGGAAASLCYAAVCVFGSRAVNADFTLYFWTYFVVMSVMYRDLIKKPDPKRGARRAERAARDKALAAKRARKEEEPELQSGAEVSEDPASTDASVTPSRRARRAKARRGAKRARPVETPSQNDESAGMGVRERFKSDKATSRANRKAAKDRLSSRRKR